MLQWVAKEVNSPYGSITTVHWAVGDSEEEVSSSKMNGTSTSSCPSNKTGSHGAVGRDRLAGLEQLLENAEDQLGAVLWNSNTVALGYLHSHVLNKSATDYRIVELGAGVGCLGIGLAMAGARVVVTDLKELVPLMIKNIELNKEKIHTRSNGRGVCSALTWRWGPQPGPKCKDKRKSASNGNKRDRRNLLENENGLPLVGQMVSSFMTPSPAFSEVQQLLDRVDLVVMCDALYGNKKDWRQLLYTLSEILAANPSCEVVNFCEQRIDNVEDEFLKLLEEENTKTCSFAPHPGTQGETLEDALLRMRGPYKWHARTEVVKEGASDLGMVVRATRIQWVRLNTTQQLKSQISPCVADSSEERQLKRSKIL
ncbi:putative Lysine methyltransferase [Trypanosoma vivax]|uniref:Methyltransferase n=1 Tax=Trypanosoma vivax (strain Y486) TaxID=1055687 RepID=G0TVH3_TRYVY|nr:putative Lysine methyltransferase [Trypanosoma vivax]CCC47939.1 conserved hypothetical protein [Trypanosoma vivax Y486]